MKRSRSARPASVVFVVGSERPDIGPAILLHQDLYPLLGGLQRLLARPRQGDAALEALQGLLEAEVALLHALDDRLEFLQGLLEIGGLRGLGCGGFRHRSLAWLPF